MAEPGPADLPAVVSRFTAALHAAGMMVGPDRAERFARAVTVADPRTLAGLRACAHATLALGRGDTPVIDAVFDAVFAGLTDPADHRGDQRNVPALEGQLTADDNPTRPRSSSSEPRSRPDGGAPQTRPGRGGEPDDETVTEVATAGSAAERLHHREFSELEPDELTALESAMAALRLATPSRVSRRYRSAPTGPRVDLRATLRLGRRQGGDPRTLVRRRRLSRPRRLVVLCDISGSMEPYARAMLQFLCCAAGTSRQAEVFVFATRLTRLTPVLSRSRPGPALARAGESAPDWSGGTRIGAALTEFLDRYGRRGMARGAVVLICSDGWETGDPAVLGRAMERLSRLAYRIVWVNPRTQSPRYRPLVGGMAAAWPHCDAVVSAHRVDALDALVSALADPHRSRSRA